MSKIEGRFVQSCQIQFLTFFSFAFNLTPFFRELGLQSKELGWQKDSWPPVSLFSTEKKSLRIKKGQEMKKKSSPPPGRINKKKSCVCQLWRRKYIPWDNSSSPDPQSCNWISRGSFSRGPLAWKNRITALGKKEHPVSPVCIRC